MASLRLISDSVCVCAAFVQGEVVRAKASKIVAGQEAKKTNEFLQLLSIAILKKVSIFQSSYFGYRSVNIHKG